jgi:hypothetical protein
MQFNGTKFGENSKALVQSPYFEKQFLGVPLPPPTDYYLLDNSGDNLLDNSGEPFITNEYP